MDSDNTSFSKVDVRIIVSGPDIAEIVSRAINNADLEKNYNILVSSIIPTMDFEIVKKVAEGADIILIGGYGADENYNILFNDLKTDFNHIGLFDYNNLVNESETFEADRAQAEILNAIIKAGLAYSLNIINIHTLENKLSGLTRKYNSLLDDYNKLIEENKVLSQTNLDLQDEATQLEDKIDEIKSDFSSFKSRYEDIYSKEILEVFEIENLWRELFNESSPSEDKITLATNEFKPADLIVGQGFICAKDKQTAIDWLKIIKTTLIFLDRNDDNLKKQLDSYSNDDVSQINDSSEYDIPNGVGKFFD